MNQKRGKGASGLPSFVPPHFLGLGGGGGPVQRDEASWKRAVERALLVWPLALSKCQPMLADGEIEFIGFRGKSGWKRKPTIALYELRAVQLEPNAGSAQRTSPMRIDPKP